MKLWLLGAIPLLSLPSVAGAQSIAGVSLGMDQKQAMAALGSTAVASVTGPETVLYLRATGTVALLCNGSVYSVQEKVGSTVHVFAQEVTQVEASRGPPAYQLRNMRMPIGQSTAVAAQWRLAGGGTWEVSYWVLNEDEPQVTRRLSRSQPGCRLPG